MKKTIYLISISFLCVVAACKKDGATGINTITNKPADLAVKVLATPVITTVAGNGTQGFTGDGGLATAAQLYNNRRIATDAVGNFYISDVGNNRIRKVNTSGIISTIAGTGINGFSGDGGLATVASLGFIQGITVDKTGNIYVACNDRIRKISTAGIITTVVGNGGTTLPNNGDGGPAINARLSSPQDVTFDKAGNMYIADWAHHRVRKVNTAGIISTLAGNGMQNYNGDGIPAINAVVQYPTGVATDTLGNVYIASANRIRKVNSSGTISTIAGNGTYGGGGDGGPAVNARVGTIGLLVDKMANIILADYSNARIRKIAISTGIITTIAGGGTVLGDGGLPTAANLVYPTGVALRTNGDLLIADYGAKRIRRVTNP
ncbi:NHL domain-containing protein [Chitinophaga sp. RAB17]|uniref:NHL domain-containing protein n=1 Tax=Chitinophaga sp. RAB17 TaxID=3233049 RepID=UPI003F8E01DD